MEISATIVRHRLTGEGGVGCLWEALEENMRPVRRMVTSERSRMERGSFSEAPRNNKCAESITDIKKYGAFGRLENVKDCLDPREDRISVV